MRTAPLETNADGEREVGGRDGGMKNREKGEGTDKRETWEGE